MQHLSFLLVGMLALGVGATELPAQSRPWVVAQILGEEQERVAFAPRLEPYSSEGPSVRVPVLSGETCQLESGELCQGFEFIGWHEADAIRVLVRALIVRESKATALPQPDRFEKREVAAVILRLGETVVVDRLRTLGVTPIELRAIER